MTAPPATAPAATSPAAPEKVAAARAALRNFFRAIVAGDSAKSQSFIIYSNPDNQKAAQAMLAQVISLQRLQKATRDLLGEKATEASFGMNDVEIASIEAGFERASVSIDGTSARITTPNGLIYTLLLKDGQWKIDFDKTQAGIGALPGKALIDSVQAQVPLIDKLTSDVRAKKFTTVEQISAELRKIESSPLAN